MTREDYALTQLRHLKTLKKRRDRLNDVEFEKVSPNRWKKVCADLNWLGMEIAQTKERIAFALGYIQADEVRKEYRPSGWHTYDGIQGELEKLKFENEF